MTIDCAFFGFLTADAEPRVSNAGKKWTRLRAGVGKDVLQWVQIAVFGDAADDAADLKKADRVYIEGTIKIDHWTSSDGVERHGLSVASHKCVRTHNIGRNRKSKQKDDKKNSDTAKPEQGAPLNDEIPF